MPTPKGGYRNANGDPIPGTTTVISNLGWNKNQLMWWAWKQGKDGLSFRDTSEKAADIGTQAHAMVEASIKNLPVPEGDPKAKAAFEEYLAWKDRTRIEIVGSEIALVSEKHQYGSTIDAMGTHNGEYEMPDWKASNGCYPDHVIQLAAYAHNWNENNPDKPVRRVHLCRFGKEGGFHHHSWAFDALEPAWDVFLALLKIHANKKRLEGMI